MSPLTSIPGKMGPLSEEHVTPDQAFHHQLRSFRSANTVLFQDATALATLVKEKKVKVATLVDISIKALELAHGATNCMVYTCYHVARMQAKEADVCIAKGGKKLGPFFGVPIVSKESFEHSGFSYTQGVVAQKDRIGKKDAVVLRRMREELGCIVLGGSNVSEACMWAESYMIVVYQFWNNIEGIKCSCLFLVSTWCTPKVQSAPWSHSESVEEEPHSRWQQRWQLRSSGLRMCASGNHSRRWRINADSGSFQRNFWPQTYWGSLAKHWNAPRPLSQSYPPYLSTRGCCAKCQRFTDLL